jgi:uncharacterized protein with HEPN domain
MKRAFISFIQDIVDEMDRLERFVEGIDVDQLRADEKTAYAMMKALEIIGEAAKQVPESVRQRAPEVRWREMAGMRDRITHGYWSVDVALIWHTVHKRFPVERPVLRRLLDELDAEAGSDA